MKTQFQIYITTNLCNNKQYIGLHSKSDDSYMGSGILLLKAIKKYGIENFTKKIIATSDNIIDANLLERKYIKKYNAVEDDNFYNLSCGGEMIGGRKHSLFTIKKILISKQKNYKDNVLLRYKVGGTTRGKVMPNTTKDALLKANIGRTNTIKSRKKMSNSAICRYYPELIYIKTGKIIPPGQNIRRLSKQLNVNQGNFNQMIRGIRKTCFGWRIN